MQADRQQMSSISMPYAPFKTRIYAFLLDYLMIAIYGIFVVGSISLIFRPLIAPLFSGSPIIAELTGFLMITLPVSLYFIVCEASKWQGTWGKKKMGIKVVNPAGGRINFGRSIARTAIKFLPWELAHFCIWQLQFPAYLSESVVLVILTAVNVVVLIYLLSPLTNKKRKTIYDWFAGTVIVSNKN